MGEIFENALQLLGFVLFAIIPIGLIAAVIDWKVSRPRKLNQFDSDRQVANLEILKILLDYTAKYPSQRFGQILRNTGVLQDVGVRDSAQQEWETPTFYIDRILIHEEPQIILERMQKELDEQNKSG